MFFFLQNGLNKERAFSCFFCPAKSKLQTNKFMQVFMLFSNECQLQMRKDGPINMVI